MASSAPRQGPRPLPQHLAMVSAIWMGSRNALPLWKNGWLGSKPPYAEALQKLRVDAAAIDPETFAAALDQEALARTAEFLRAVERYRRHPYRRDLIDPPVCWQDGTTTLRDYASLFPKVAKGRPVLVIPSLINRAYILDLMQDLSFVRFLAGQGLRPFLVDWGAPGAAEREFSLTDYIAGRLEAVLDHVWRVSGQAPALVGYCMGGALALALAARRPRDITGLVLLATPWNFHAVRPAQSRLIGALSLHLEPTIALLDEAPADLVQMFFTALDPFLVPRKYARFASWAPESTESKLFVAVEDWVNDSVPLPAKVFREGLRDWYGTNAPLNHHWRVAGRPIVPEELRVPAFVVIPGQDRIVPPESAKILARIIPGAQSLTPVTGHIGMMVGRKAPQQIWTPVADWIKSNNMTD